MNKNQNQNPEEEILKNEEAENLQQENETQAEETNSAENAGEEKEAELSEEEKAAKELEETKQALEDYKDKYLRLSAEFDNYRKRTMKEKAELIKNGGEKAISAILPILDDLERALQNMQKAEDVKAMHEGIDLIYQKFLKNLGHEGLEKMNPVGEAFDTDFHEAIALVPAQEEAQKGKILDCVQTGYKLNDKVIRHAKVVVAQ
ncbi:nucleotide exchange factor GrpE [Bacteroides caecigallinarum]|uniref:nucleotide exchange factor GrpE n=1 Tax=Bacteroides caecigallinarum TaxID=1411144 RepID=UPI001F1B7B29|nr:nucleotide exchange factor GrpE [Bacteroides caecigallinarum]MCF2552669.1 nucleotide exchange factor GrpE [Bacteroides caecigallinarum]